MDDLEEKLLPKTQIVYVPPHLQNEDIVQPFPYGMEPGFITSGPTDDGSYFCMFWQLSIDGYITSDLRTRSNSELTPSSCIYTKDTVDQSEVERVWKRYRG